MFGNLHPCSTVPIFVSLSAGKRCRLFCAVPSAAAIQTWDAAFCQGNTGIHRQPDPASVLERVHSQAGHCQRPGCHPPHTCRLPQQSHLQVRAGTARVYSSIYCYTLLACNTMCAVICMHKKVIYSSIYRSGRPYVLVSPWMQSILNKPFFSTLSDHISGDWELSPFSLWEQAQITLYIKWLYA